MTNQTAKAGSPAQFSLKVTRGRDEEIKQWQTAVSPMFRIAPLAAEERARFAMKTEGYFLPGLAITKTTSSGCTFKRTRDLIAKSGIENILVQIYLKGSYGLDVEGIQLKVAAGDIVVLDLARESTIKATAYTNIALTLQREMIAPIIVDMDKLHGVVLRKGTPRNIFLTSVLTSLHAEASHFSVAEQSAIAQGTAAMMASCILPSLTVVDSAKDAAATATLQTIRRAIEKRLDDLTMTPESIAAQYGLSRTSMYRMFEPLGGVRSYIQQRRLMHAYQIITNPSRTDEPIGNIGKRLGFAESASFSRAFRALYKMTPSEVRAAARAGHISSHRKPQSGEASYSMLNRWLLGLDANGDTKN